MKSIAAGLLVAAAAYGAAASAQDAKPAVATKPTVYALVSAVGGDLTFVRQREQVGSNRVDTFDRLTLKVPDASLDGAVLRGLAKVLRSNEPDAVFHYMRLNPQELAGIKTQVKGEAALGKLAKAFETMPERKDWDRIVVVTPKYLFPGRSGMGSKLSGLGVYVQPLYSATGSASGVLGGVEDLVPGGVSAEEDAMTPEGEHTPTSRYVAPYFYTQLWILDAKTLTVLDTEERYDFQKLYDPKSTAIDVQRSFTPEQLSSAVDAFVERSAARALREAVGTVTVSEPKPVQEPKKTP
ncbi:hypothetical protein BWI17_08485 [Betaproteobacteria bacterium GR16-43]|nr:hypothetical protein BWI17_08485 [Betaproteobacteria bacterium GR16-43]